MLVRKQFIHSISLSTVKHFTHGYCKVSKAGKLMQLPCDRACWPFLLGATKSSRQVITEELKHGPCRKPGKV